MTQIPIKIEREWIWQKKQIEPEKEIPKIEPQKPVQKNKIKAWLFLIIGIFLTGAIISVFFFFQKTNGLEKILPKDPAAVIVFEKDRIKNIFLNLEQNGWLWSPFEDLKKTGSDFLTRNQIDFQKTFEAFEGKMALGLFKDASDNLEWLAVAEIRIGSNDFERQLTEIKRNLKQNFNLFSETYRQTEIWQIENLSGQNPPIFFAKTKNYFLAGTNQEIIKQAIDRILKIKR